VAALFTNTTNIVYQPAAGSGSFTTAQNIFAAATPQWDKLYIGGALTGLLTPTRINIIGSGATMSSGANMQAYVGGRTRPSWQMRAADADDIDIAFDAGFNGTHWLSESSNSNMLIHKDNVVLQFMYASGFGVGAEITAWQEAAAITSSGGGRFQAKNLIFTTAYTVTQQLLDRYQYDTTLTATWTGAPFGSGNSVLIYPLRLGRIIHLTLLELTGTSTSATSFVTNALISELRPTDGTYYQHVTVVDLGVQQTGLVTITTAGIITISKADGAAFSAIGTAGYRRISISFERMA
jgi:hypothetical protein